VKTVNTYYLSDEQLMGFISQNGICDSEKLLIQVFTAENDKDFLHKLTAFFNQQFPLALLIGATTDGEIKDGKVSTGKTVISFTQFEHTRLKGYISDSNGDYNSAGQDMASALIEDETKAIIAFIDGLSGNGEEFLKGMDSVCPGMIVTGGLAGDNATFTQIYVFDKERILSNGVVGASLSYTGLHILTDYCFNWHPIGKILHITKSDGNRVYTIDDKTAVDTYKYYLGENIGDQLPHIGIEFPLIIQKDGVDVARAAISKMEDGSLIFAGNLNNGAEVRFGYGDLDILRDTVHSHVDKLFSKPIESIFIYSCMARRRFIPDSIEYETCAYNDIATTSGFYTYGEFYSSATSKELLNQSMSIIALSESDKPNKHRVTTEASIKKSTAIQALTHLVSVSTQELEEAQKRLERLAATDPLTRLCNRRHFFDISNNLYHHSERHSRPLSVVLMDVDRFKMINDNYGHHIGDKILVELALILKSHGRRKSDLICRYGGEEFIMLLPDTDRQEAAIIAENLRKDIEQRQFKIENDQTIQFTISLGVAQVDLDNKASLETTIHLADKALYASKSGGRNRVTLSSDQT
jgi:diguanylate cyclase (GGDEF)-like protein